PLSNSVWPLPSTYDVSISERKESQIQVKGLELGVSEGMIVDPMGKMWISEPGKLIKVDVYGTNHQVHPLPHKAKEASVTYWLPKGDLLLAYRDGSILQFNQNTNEIT